MIPLDIKKKCARNKTRIQKSKKQTPNQSSIRSYLTNATSSSTSNLQNNPLFSIYFSGDKLLSDDEEFDPTFIHKVIPTDISLETLTFVAIPCWRKKALNSNENITKVDISQIKHRVEAQIHVQIYKPYLHGKIMYFEKTENYPYLKSRDLIGLAHPQIQIKIGDKELVRFNRALLEILHRTTPISSYHWHDYSIC